MLNVYGIFGIILFVVIVIVAILWERHLLRYAQLSDSGYVDIPPTPSCSGSRLATKSKSKTSERVA